ncbi:MAG: hypothetical protein JO239_04930 [Paraburkholderia sp.]|nr:hypothetical protein [Paraburkholderia sp.]
MVPAARRVIGVWGRPRVAMRNGRAAILAREHEERVIVFADILLVLNQESDVVVEVLYPARADFHVVRPGLALVR